MVVGLFILCVSLVHLGVTHAAVIQNGLINEDFSDLKILEEWSPAAEGGSFTTDGEVATLALAFTEQMGGWTYTYTGVDHGVLKMIDTTNYTGLSINVVSISPQADLEVYLPNGQTFMGRITAPGEYYLPWAPGISGTDPMGQIFLVAHGNGSVKIDSLMSVNDCSAAYDAGFAAGVAAHANDYQNGYNAGWNDGSNYGYTAGYAAGGAAHANDYQNGYNAGWNDGSNYGYTAGYAAGYTAGHAVGYAKGYSDGWDALLAKLPPGIQKAIEGAKGFGREGFTGFSGK